VRAVIDTNVLLVANGQHPDVTPDCVIECVIRLQALQHSGIAVIDDDYRILGEYQKKTCLKPANRVGDKFLKWLMQHMGTLRVEQVALKESGGASFVEFPDIIVDTPFDPPDRKFVAVAHAHPEKPPIWQAVDCKWLDWWPALQNNGVRVEFLCPHDACKFYGKKFPAKAMPDLPR
jgi:hypothetical protein